MQEDQFVVSCMDLFIGYFQANLIKYVNESEHFPLTEGLLSKCLSTVKKMLSRHFHAMLDLVQKLLCLLLNTFTNFKNCLLSTQGISNPMHLNKLIQIILMAYWVAVHAPLQGLQSEEEPFQTGNAQ